MEATILFVVWLIQSATEIHYMDSLEKKWQIKVLDARKVTPQTLPDEERAQLYGKQKPMMLLTIKLAHTLEARVKRGTKV